MLIRYTGVGGFIKCEEISGRSWWVSLVYIKPRSRGRGHAKTLMARVLRDADIDRVTLRLCVPAHTYGLSPEQLGLWYQRLGFKPRGTNFIRRPRKFKGLGW